MATLYMILKEASKRYNFNDPTVDIRQLKVEKSDITPLSIDEVWRFIGAVRADFKNYYIVRFFTGMRTSEIDGLTWEHVDFEKRQIKIRQALVIENFINYFLETNSHNPQITSINQIYATCKLD